MNVGLLVTNLNYMREIKFRAWDKQAKKMWLDGSSAINLILHDSFDGGMLIPQASIELMQYTGLKDKNGKEIYEGDIIRNEDELGEEATGEMKLREVKWYELGAGWRVGSDDKDTYFNGLGVYADRFEIIGNIYENPELIK